MDADVLTLGLRNVRSTDTNSLLRLYDQAKILWQGPGSPQERALAAKAMQRFARELRKRNVRF
jgi:hypothetical protein